MYICVKEKSYFQLLHKPNKTTIFILLTGSAGVLAGARPKITPQQSNTGIQIFSDENQSPSYSLPPQTGQWRTAPNEETYSKENEQKPGVWTKQKVRDSFL